jgi:hypothetical protein
MFAFTLVWLSQLVSVLATNMTQFGLTIWVYEKTGQATALALMQVFFITPFLLLSPLAGALVDRYNRKVMMMVSDLTAGVGTVFLLVMQATGQLQVWHLYLAAVLAGLGNCFQWPAYSAAISTMVPKAQLGRANGMWSLMEAGPGVFSPLLAGALLPFIGLTGIMFFDVATFVLAILVLSVVFVPQPQRSEAGKEAQGSLLQESIYGFKYIFARPSLLGLQMIFFFGNLFAGIGFTVLAPMILARTSNSASALGAVQSAGAVGGVIGGVIMSAWGGTKRRVHGVLFGHVLAGLSTLWLGLGRGVVWWAVPLFLGASLIPWINGSNQAIWQSKVPPDVQGRVFSARRLIAWFTQPIAPIIGGLLADYVLEPSMKTGGFATMFSNLVGAGSGAGMALLLAVCGAATLLVGLSGYLFPVIRNAEDLLSDHDAAVPVSAEAAQA